MGQILLPFFPESTRMITPILGVHKQGEEVYYMYCGMPLFIHNENDLRMFRYVTSRILLNGYCKNDDIVRFFCVSPQSVKRYKRLLSKVGEAGFFTDARKGTSYKLTPKVLERIQTRLFKGDSNSLIAREEGLSEGSIRYAISTGKLIKKKT